MFIIRYFANVKILHILIFIFFISINCFSQNKTEEYIEKYKEIAIAEMHMYAIPASITLAQGILESGNGESRLAIEGNNHFGIKCNTDWKGERIYEDDDKKNECFRKYNKVFESFRDHSIFLSKRDRYQFLFNESPTDYRAWAKGLKKAGYATNPNYADRLIDIIEEYDLYQYDKSSYSADGLISKSSNNYNTGTNFGLPFGYGIGGYWFSNNSLYSLEFQSSVALSNIKVGYHHNIGSNFYVGGSVGTIYMANLNLSISIFSLQGPEYPYFSISPEILYKLNRKEKRDILIRVGFFPLYVEKAGVLGFTVRRKIVEWTPFLNLTYLIER